MRKTFLKTGKLPAVAWVAAVLFLFPAPAWGGDIIINSSSGTVAGETGLTAVNNSVTVTTNGHVTGNVYGGHVLLGPAGSARANYNTVIVESNGRISSGNVYGAYSEGSGEVIGNRVFINGGTISDTTIAGGYDATGFNIVSGNQVTINGGTITSTHISGGRANSLSSGTTSITGNTVTINGGTITISGTPPGNGIFGGEMIGSGHGTVANNNVLITGGTITATGSAFNIYGGYTSIDGNVAGNQVTISGGSIGAAGHEAHIYGGYSATGNATGNTVTLSGSPAIIGSLYGGGGAGDYFTGNLLQLMEYRGSSFTSVSNFERYRFCLPPSLDYGYLAADTVNLNGPGGAASTVIEVHIMTKGATVTPADGRIYLIKTSGGITGTMSNITSDKADMNVLQGTTLYYSGTLTKTANELFLDNVSDPQVNPPAKNNVEGSNTGSALLNRGADLVAGPGLEAAFEAEAGSFDAQVVSEECLSRSHCLKSFTALSGGHLRYNHGSADMDSISVLTGLARGTDLPFGRLTLGGFLEYGFGTYGTYGYYTDVIKKGPDLYIEGDGLAWHLGGGLLSRLNLSPWGSQGSHAYVEGSLRAGQMTNYYGHLYPDKIMGQWEWVEFETSAPYYGAHLGLGHLWNLSGATGLDTYVKYLWSRQEGDSVKLKPFGDPIRFEAVDSQRLLTGLRLSHAFNEKVRPYIGAAYDYEFDGKSSATTHGLPIESHSLRGATRMGEVGLSFRPEPGKPVVLDLGLQGYTGMKEGFTGAIQLKVEF